ncbi:hypothetical protein [Roseibium sp. SCP14]|uniref:hypothetical protein n=1 Tax=Roseibium sp. SCP14 TaxID=3141375 RepID=UPI00333BE60D
MKLSNDLAMLKKQLIERRLPNGELRVSAADVELLNFVLDDCIYMAWQLEVSRVQRHVNLTDLDDPKIAILPVIKRPEPVVIPIRTPDGDGVA